MNTAKAIDNEILKRLPQLNSKQKQTVLNVVKTFAEHQADWWNEISEEQQNAIDKSLAQMKKGKFTAHSKAMEKYKK